MTPWPALLAEVEPFYLKGEGAWPAADRAGAHAAHVHRRTVLRLSDQGTEDALYHSQAIRSFVGIDLSREGAPDTTTLLKFRRLLEARQRTERIRDINVTPELGRHC